MFRASANRELRRRDPQLSTHRSAQCSAHRRIESFVGATPPAFDSPIGAMFRASVNRGLRRSDPASFRFTDQRNVPRIGESGASSERPRQRSIRRSAQSSAHRRIGGFVGASSPAVDSPISAIFRASANRGLRRARPPVADSPIGAMFRASVNRGPRRRDPQRRIRRSAQCSAHRRIESFVGRDPQRRIHRSAQCSAHR